MKHALKKQSKRVLVLLMVLAMLVSLFPAVGMAISTQGLQVTNVGSNNVTFTWPYYAPANMYRVSVTEQIEYCFMPDFCMPMDKDLFRQNVENNSTISLNTLTVTDLPAGKLLKVAIEYTSNFPGGYKYEAVEFTTKEPAAEPTDITLSSSSIAENAGSNATVGTLSATDVDAGDTFTYSLVSGTGDTDNASFNISETSLRANDNFDFETKSSYSVRVRVTDSGGLTFEKAFTINVMNVNEAATDITLSSTSIAENGGANAVVGTLSNNDPDASGVYTYSLVSGTGSTDNASFNISGTSLRATAGFDFETKTSYAIRVQVSDGTLTFAKPFTITVTNVNEAATDITLSSTSIAENGGANAVVGTLSNNDPDAGGVYTYSLVSGTGSTDNASFNISGTNLRANAGFDFETKTSYAIRVQVSDGTLMFAKPFTITVTNVNEAATDITLSSTSIAENGGANAVVGTLSATDADAGDTATFSLVSGTGDTDNASFNINGTSLRANDNFDFETKSSYSVRVRVTDSGSLTYEKSFTISVTDVNENTAPTDISLSADTIAENSASGTTVGTLSATDADSDATKATFSLVAGDGDADNESFILDGTTLQTATSFDYETKSSYSIRVQVTDAEGATYAEKLTINVTDVNDTPTDIALSNTSIAENAGANATVGTLSGTDADAGATLTFSLVPGVGDTDNGLFNIDGTTLKANGSFDVESKSSYSVRVQVSDGNLSYEEAFLISVTDVNEAPASLILTGDTIAENAGVDAVVGSFLATDTDLLTNVTFSFSLVAGEGDTDNGQFQIDGDSLKAKSSFDFETKSVYSIRVQVSDGALTLEQPFTVKVSNVNEAPTDISLSASTVNDNSVAGTTVGTLSATDVDAGSTFTYSLVSGEGDTDNTSFTIDGVTLKTAAAIDYETKTSHSIRVQVSDGGLTYEKVFPITVIDVAEAPAFADVPFSAWYSPAIEFLAKKKVLNGNGVGQFNPNNKMTRAEFVKMLVTAFEINPSSTGAMTFSDMTNANAWHHSYVLAASRAKIINGFPDGTFKPNALLTRQEMMVLLHRAMKYKGFSLPSGGPSLSTYKDADKVSKHATSIINELVKANIATGSNGLLRTNVESTKAEGAAIIYRALKLQDN